MLAARSHLARGDRKRAGVASHRPAWHAHDSELVLRRLDPAAERYRVIEQLERDFPNTVLFPLTQPDFTDLERVGYLPGLLAGLVALLAWEP
jgi:hypothetical protein